MREPAGSGLGWQANICAILAQPASVAERKGVNMNWFITVFKKYAVFSGRARRAEYWYFTLFFIIFSVALSFIDMLTGMYDPETGAGVLSGLFGLVLLLPSIGVSIRRLHDTDRSGWWFLLVFVPVIGWIVLIIFFVQAGTTGANRFGPDPKAGAA